MLVELPPFHITHIHNSYAKGQECIYRRPWGEGIGPVGVLLPYSTPKDIVDVVYPLSKSHY
jgi:hypothetical protein